MTLVNRVLTGQSVAMRGVQRLTRELPRRPDGKVDWRTSARLSYRVVSEPGRPLLARWWVIGFMFCLFPIPSLYWVVFGQDTGTRLAYALLCLGTSFLAVAMALLLADRIGEEYREELDELRRADRDRERGPAPTDG